MLEYSLTHATRARVRDRCGKLIPVVLVIIGLTAGVCTPPIAHAQTAAATQRVILKMRDGIQPPPQGVFTSYSSKSTVKTMHLSALDIVILEVPGDWDAGALISELVKDPAVEYGARDQAVRVQSVRPDDLHNDPDPNNRQWGLERVQPTDVDINAPRGWAYTTGSAEVVIGVLDTGIDYSAPDLKNNMWINQAEAQGTIGIDDDGNGFVDDVHGYDFTDKFADANNESTSPYDDDQDTGHGTAVAGVIAAQGNNGLGAVGVAWNASLMAIKVSDRNGNSMDSNIVMGMNYVVEMKRRGVNIRAVNISIGRSQDENFDPDMARVVEDVVRRLDEEGILVIFAAGNGGKDVDAADNPTMFSRPLTASTQNNIILVAGNNRDGSRWAFSNYGLTSVDLAAPGSNVYAPHTRLSNFGTKQTSGTAGLLFDNAEPASPGRPSTFTKWLPAPAGDSSPTFLVLESPKPTTTVWTNDNVDVTRIFTYIRGGFAGIQMSPGGEAVLEYGPFDLSAFPTTQTRVLINFKTAYDISFLRREFRVQAKNGSTDWITIRRPTGNSGSSQCPNVDGCWQEINVAVPPYLCGDSAFKFRFQLRGLDTSNPPSLQRLIDAGSVYLDDIGIGSAASAPTPYRLINGTSLAAPFVTGAVALLASHRPDLDHLAIRRAILDNVRRTTTWETLVTSGGILDIAAALASVTTPGFTVTPAHPVFINGEPTPLTIALTREPGAVTDTTDDDQVIVQLVGNAPSRVTIQPATLTFTAENWHIPQPITVTATRADALRAPVSTSLRISVVPDSSDSVYHDVTTEILADTLAVNRVHLSPDVINPGETVTVSVELSRVAPVPIALTLTLTVDTPTYSTEVAARIAVGEHLTSFTLVPNPSITAPVRALTALTAIRTDIDAPLNLPQLPTLRITPDSLLRLRIRAFLEGALQ